MQGGDGRGGGLHGIFPFTLWLVGGEQSGGDKGMSQWAWVEHGIPRAERDWGVRDADAQPQNHVILAPVKCVKKKPIKFVCPLNSFFCRSHLNWLAFIWAI